MLKKTLLIIILTLCIFLLPKLTYTEKFTVPKDDIIFVPLDSRPVNTQNVKLLTAMWGKNLLLPPIDVLDDYTKPGNFDRLNKWLIEAVSKNNVCAVVISVQQYINGGLIASRDIKNYKNYDERLLSLYKFIKENKDKNITIFSVIPRLTPTQFSDSEYIKYSQQLKQFSALKDIVDLYHKKSDINELNRIKSQIPVELINRYNDLFEINKNINQKLIDWSKEGLIKTLAIGIDDTAKFSMSNMISRELNQYAKLNGVSGKVYMLHGADELGMEITARLANEFYRQSPGFRVVYDVENPEKVFLPFEGADLKKIVEEKINFIGGKTASDGESILYIHTHENSGIKNDIQKYKNIGQNFGIADVAYANMADKNLIDAMLKYNPLDISYAGWNTPSNAIGTVISEMSLKMILDKGFIPLYKGDESIKRFISFSFIRLADDFAYQAVVRNKMYKWAKSNDMNAVDIDRKSADEELSRQMKPLLDEIKSKYTGKVVVAKDYQAIIGDIKAKVWYPWSRMFEIEVEPDVILQKGQ